MNINILRLDTIGSTNDEAVRHAKLGAAEGLCIIARHQTAGRGRQGRDWSSEADAGLYFSIVLRPKIENRFLPLVTLMAGVAVYDTLKEFGLSPDIKWVNDILVGEKKISGILAETADTPDGLAVIVGIGVNLTSGLLPLEVADSATSIEAAVGKSISAKDLAEVLTRFLNYFYELLCDDGGPSAIIEHWRRRSSYFTKKEVRVRLAGEDVVGVTDGLTEIGALRLRAGDGTVRIIQAGDVQRLRSG